MLKPFQLLFNPALTWEKIDQEQRSTGWVLFAFFLPWLLASVGFESACLLVFGDPVGPFETPVKLSLPLVLRYGISIFVLDLALVLGGALLLTRVGDSFHSRHTFQECFTTLAYSISPLFVLRFLDGCPAINTWICYAIGVLLTISFLYRGLPRTLKPEPSNALGMYLFVSVFILIASGLAHYIGTLILNEKIWRSPTTLSFFSAC